MTKGMLLRSGAAICLFAFGLALGHWTSVAPSAAVETIASERLATAPPDTTTRALSKKVDRIPTEEIGKLYDQLAPLTSLDSVRSRRKLASRWVLEDPDGLLESGHRSEVLSQWARMDAEGLLATVLAKEDGNLLREAMYAASVAAPSTLLSFLEKHPEFQSEAIYQIPRAIRELARTDPESAAEFLIRLKVSPDTTTSEQFEFGTTTAHSNSHNVFGKVAALLARKDRHAAFDWIASLDSLQLRQRAQEHVLAEWILESPGEAGDFFQLQAGNSGIDPERVIRQIIQEDPAGAILWGIENARPGQKRELLIDFATDLREMHDIREVYNHLDDPKLKSRFTQHLLMNWRDRPLSEGLDWILSMPEEQHERWIRELGNGVGTSQFDSGLALATSIADPDLRKQFEYGIVKSLAGTDLERAIEYARQSGDQDLLDETLEWGYYTHADNPAYSFEEVASWLKEIEWSTYHSDVSGSLTRRWYQADPDAALAWVDSLEGQARTTAVYQLARAMKSTGSRDAVAWASQLKEPADRSAAIPALLHTLAFGSPAEAFPLALRLDNPKERLRETRDVIKIWAKRQPDKAREAIASSTVLSDQDKRSLAVFFYDQQ